MTLPLSRRRILLSSGTALALAALAACSSKDSATGDSSQGAGGPAPSGSAAAGGYPATITHAQGTLTLDKAPRSVVVFDPGVLDSLVALGLSDVVVGVPQDKTSYPDSLSQFADSGKYTNVGSMFEPNVEAIAELDPDLVIVARRSADAYEKLSGSFPTIDMTVSASPSTASPEAASPAADGAGGEGGGRGGGRGGDRPSATATATLTSHATILGAAFDKTAEAQTKVSEFTAAAAEVAAVAKNAGKGLALMTSGGEVTAFGTGSRFDVIFNEFGVAPAVEDIKAATHGEAVSFEFIGSANPDLLFVLDRDATIGQEGTSAQQILNNDLVTATNAWKNNKVFYLNGGNWYVVGAGFAASPAMAEEIKSDLSA